MGKKLAIGLLAVALLAVAAYFGVQFYARHQAVAQVDRAFDELRQRGASARFADATVDPVGRGITLRGVEIVSKDKTATLSVEKLTASGAAPPRDGYVEADVLDLDGVKITVSGPPVAGGTLTYTVPKVMIDQYRGPVNLVAAPGAAPASSPEGALALALRQLAATAAAKVTIPAMSAHITSATAGVAPLDVAYEGIAAEQVAAGKIRSLIIDRATFKGPAHLAGARTPATDATAQPPVADAVPIEGEMTGIVAARIDTGPLLAIVSHASAQPGDDDYQEIYGKVVTGPYWLKYPTGERSSAASILLEHVGVKPAAFTEARLQALESLSEKGPDLSIEEARELLQHMTDVLQAVAFRTMAMTRARTEGPEETVEIASITLDGLAAGVLDGFEIKGVNGQAVGGQPVKLGRLAVRLLDLPAMVRLAEDADSPSLPGILGLFKVIKGIEASGIEVPYDKANGAAEPQTVKVGGFSLSWGSFLGDLPTTLRMELSDATGPISASDGEPFTYLANGGMTSATLGAGLNIAYDAQARDLTIAPVRVKVDKAFSVEMSAGVGNLPKEAFLDAASAFGALTQLNGRPFSLKIENLGLAELMITQLAEASDITPDALRQELLVTIDEQAKDWAEVTKDAPAVAEAVKAFVMNPKTLTLTATPRTNAPLMPLVMSDDPFAVLQAFDIKAEVGP